MGVIEAIKAALRLKVDFNIGTEAVKLKLLSYIRWLDVKPLNLVIKALQRVVEALLGVVEPSIGVSQRWLAMITK